MSKVYDSEEEFLANNVVVPRSKWEFVCEIDGKNPKMVVHDEVIYIMCEDRPLRYLFGDELRVCEVQDV